MDIGPCIVFIICQGCYFLAVLHMLMMPSRFIYCPPCTSTVPDFMDTVFSCLRSGIFLSSYHLDNLQFILQLHFLCYINDILH
jgi:hypothetical protein